MTSVLVVTACGPRESDARRDTASPPVARPVVAAAAAGDSVIATTVAEVHACALVASGAAYCWGSNESWQLGVDLPPSAPSEIPTPVLVAGGHHFTAIAAGRTVTCALDIEAKAWCWGWGPEGRLGTGRMQDTAVVPKAVTGSARFTTIEVGDRHACALDPDGAAWCWGANQYGMLGDSARPRASAIPVRVAGGHRFRQISVGGRTTCATATDDSAWCWGSNSSGELGDSTSTDNSAVPVRVHLDDVAEIHPVVGATCARSKANGVWCWGARSTRLFADSGLEAGGGPARHPIRVASAAPSVARLFVGQSQACTLSTSGEASCWGSGASPVEGLTFAGLSLSGLDCGPTRDGHAYCWGHDLITEAPITKPVRIVFPLPR